jgi:AbiV family abortive infection protein
MKRSLSEQDLLRGAWYALEQAGRLVRGSVVLFDSGDRSTAVGVAMLAREELGRSRILRSLGKGANEKAAPILVAEVEAALQDHAAKQRAAAWSVTLTAPHGTPLNELMWASMREPPSSDVWRQDEQSIETAAAAKRKRLPADRHQLRMRAFYVDLSPDGTWKRPVDIGHDEALAAVNETSNDYAQERDRLRDEVIEADCPEMASARRLMSPAPVLVEPQWPRFAC